MAVRVTRLPSLLCTNARLISRPHILKSVTAITTRSYATPAPDTPPEVRVPDALIEKFQKAPKTLAKVQEVMQIFLKKGIALDKPPGVIEMMNLARDKEVMGAMRELKETMDEDGVTGDVLELMKGGMGGFGFPKKP